MKLMRTSMGIPEYGACDGRGAVPRMAQVHLLNLAAAAGLGLGLTLLGCQPGDRIAGRTTGIGRAVTVQEIVAYIHNVPEWSRLTHLESVAPEAWALILRTARLMQLARDETVYEALRQHYLLTMAGRYDEDDVFDESTKPMLLLRVMFQLPRDVRVGDILEDKPSVERVWPTGAWEGSPLSMVQVRPELRFDFSWPVRWDDGKPGLADRYGGYCGAPFRAHEEYKRWREVYPYRDLGEGIKIVGEERRRE